jgi:DNA-binding LacI/PurR family transcriptional regulator
VDRRQRAFLARAAEVGLNVILGTPSTIWESPLSEADWAVINDRSLWPLAVVGWEDSTAHASALQLTHRGLRIPEDIGVMGFNGSPGPFPLRFDLTTISAGWDQVARRAIECIVHLLDGRDVPVEQHLPVSLHLGGTVRAGAEAKAGSALSP